MPYKRRYTKYSRRSNYRRRPRAPARSIGYGDITRKVMQDVAYLRSLINVEFKHLENVNSATSSTTAALILLNGMAPGDTGETRDGQSIRMKSVLMRGTILVNPSATATVHRTMLFLDTQPNGAAPGIGDILDTATNVLSPINISNGSRFKILKDLFHNVDVAANPIITFQKFVKLGFHTKYNAGTAGTIADITTNALYILHMSSEATNTATFNYYFRSRFIDN